MCADRATSRATSRSSRRRTLGPGLRVVAQSSNVPVKIKAEEAQLEGAVELATLMQTSLEDSRPGHSCEQTDSLARRLSTFAISTWDTTRRLL